MNSLAKIEECKKSGVLLGYFGGLSIEKTAEVLKISIQTELRDRQFAKIWLLLEWSNQ